MKLTACAAAAIVIAILFIAFGALANSDQDADPVASIPIEPVAQVLPQEPPAQTPSQPIEAEPEPWFWDWLWVSYTKNHEELRDLFLSIAVVIAGVFALQRLNFAISFKNHNIWVVLGFWCFLVAFGAWLTWDYLLFHHDKVRNLSLVAAALIGAPVVLWRTAIAHEESQIRDRDTKIREGDLKTRKQDANTNSANVVTAAYTQAIEHLSAYKSNGVINLQTRLSAIFALEQIAKQNDEYGPQVIAVLSIYVSEETFAPPPASFPEGLSFPRFLGEEGEYDLVFDYPRTFPTRPRDDIQAIVSGFSRKSESWVKNALNSLEDGLNFSNCHLAGVRFQPQGFVCGFYYCDLTLADLSYSYFMAGSTFRNCSLFDARIIHSRLSMCFWKNSILSKAELGFSDIRRGWQQTERQLQGVDLRQTKRDRDLVPDQAFPDDNDD